MIEPTVGQRASFPGSAKTLQSYATNLSGWLTTPSYPIFENGAKIEWLVRLRWVVICLQILSLIPGILLGFVDRSNIWTYLLVMSSAIVLNIVTTSREKANDFDKSNGSVSFQLFFDVTQFSVLLALAGGWTNPFSSIIFVYAALGGALLSIGNKIRLGAYIFVLVFILQKRFSLPLEINNPDVGLWVGTAVDGVVLSAIMFLIAALSRNLINREKVLTELKDQHLRLDRLRAIGTLSGAFCHQMATPINSIKLRTNRIARKTTSDQKGELSDDLASIKSSVEQCEIVLKKLTNVHLDPEQVLFQYQDMVDLITNCVEVWQREEQPVGLEISTQLPRSCWMNFPGVMMTQVILDLLDNAAEAIPESRNGSIQITLTHDESMCSLSVEDNGTGFPLHIKQHLGEPFNTSKTKGNGLGLYHASLLAQLMGGELKIESNDPSGEGTKITIICRKEMHVDR